MSSTMPALFEGDVVEMIHPTYAGEPWLIVSVGRTGKATIENAEGKQGTIPLSGLREYTGDKPFVRKERTKYGQGAVVRWVSPKVPKGVDRGALYVVVKPNDHRDFVNVVRLGGEPVEGRYYRAGADSLEQVEHGEF